VTAFREHAENGSRLLELVTGAEADAAGVFAQIAKTAAALERDLTKVRARLRRSAKAR
jgi:ribosome-associated translation inhibitor RaiA